MKRLILVLVLMFGVSTACGDESVNPSDVSQAGTGLAIVSSIADPAEQPRQNDTGTNNADANSQTVAPSEYDGSSSRDDNCALDLTVDGLSRLEDINEDGICYIVDGVGGRSLIWTTGMGSDLILFLPGGLGATTMQFETNITVNNEPIDGCTVTLSLREPYTGASGNVYEVWRGSASCAGPPTAELQFETGGYER